MKKSKRAGRAGLTAALLSCLCVATQYAQSPTWDKYGPATRYQATAVYDSASDMMVVFGGQHTTTSQDFSDLWWAPNITKSVCQPPCTLQWNHPAAKVNNTPPARFGHAWWFLAGPKELPPRRLAPMMCGYSKMPPGSEEPQAGLSFLPLALLLPHAIVIPRCMIPEPT